MLRAVSIGTWALLSAVAPATYGVSSRLGAADQGGVVIDGDAGAEFLDRGFIHEFAGDDLGHASEMVVEQ